MSDQKRAKPESELSQEELLEVIKIFMTSEDFYDSDKAQIKNNSGYTEVAALRHAAEGS